MLKWRNSVFIAVLIVTLLWIRSPFHLYGSAENESLVIPPISKVKNVKSLWANIPQQFPVTSIKPLPTGPPTAIPKIQHNFKRETATEKKIRLNRLNAVRGNFTHAWKGYKEHAWLRDEVQPISGGFQDPFGGWAATLVDSLGVQCDILRQSIC